MSVVYLRWQVEKSEEVALGMLQKKKSHTQQIFIALFQFLHVCRALSLRTIGKYTRTC